MAKKRMTIHEYIEHKNHIWPFFIKILLNGVVCSVVDII